MERKFRMCTVHTRSASGDHFDFLEIRGAKFRCPLPTAREPETIGELGSLLENETILTQ